jgi:hypothetical protein
LEECSDERMVVAVTHSVVGIVEPKAAHGTHLLTRERREQCAYGQLTLRHLCGGVECGTHDFMRDDGFALVRGKSDCVYMVV